MAPIWKQSTDCLGTHSNARFPRKRAHTAQGIASALGGQQRQLRRPDLRGGRKRGQGWRRAEVAEASLEQRWSTWWKVERARQHQQVPIVPARAQGGDCPPGMAVSVQGPVQRPYCRVRGGWRCFLHTDPSLRPACPDGNNHHICC